MRPSSCSCLMQRKSQSSTVTQRPMTSALLPLRPHLFSSTTLTTPSTLELLLLLGRPRVPPGPRPSCSVFPDTLLCPRPTASRLALLFHSPWFYFPSLHLLFSNTPHSLRSFSWVGICFLSTKNSYLCGWTQNGWMENNRMGDFFFVLVTE